MHTGSGLVFVFFFFNDTATTEIYTLSLHDALPIYLALAVAGSRMRRHSVEAVMSYQPPSDRKSTRLNSSHSQISYAVFCLKKKNRRQRCNPRCRGARQPTPPLSTDAS